MRRRLLGTLLWCLLVPLVGCIRLPISSLRWLAFLRRKTLLTLGGLGLALSLPNPVTAQFSMEGITLRERTVLTIGQSVMGVMAVLVSGLRSRTLRRLRGWMRQQGWYV